MFHEARVRSHWTRRATQRLLARTGTPRVPRPVRNELHCHVNTISHQGWRRHVTLF